MKLEDVAEAKKRVDRALAIEDRLKKLNSFLALAKDHVRIQVCYYGETTFPILSLNCGQTSDVKDGKSMKCHLTNAVNDEIEALEKELASL